MLFSANNILFSQSLRTLVNERKTDNMDENVSAELARKKIIDDFKENYPDLYANISVDMCKSNPMQVFVSIISEGTGSVNG